MKRWLSIAGLSSALYVTACGGDCGYVTTNETAHVSVIAAPGYATDCNGDPVEITLSWGNGQAYEIFRYNGELLSRACAKSVGLVDGADVRIKAKMATKSPGSVFGIQPCQEQGVTLLDADISICDNECIDTRTCPVAAPPPGEVCKGSLSCYYGPEVKCPLEPGTTEFLDCVDGVWVANQKQNCDVCAVSCEPPPPCISCGEVDSTKPPAQFDFCTQASADLYQAVWDCTCVAGNVCEPVCNAAPAGATSLCAGGAMSTECATCMTSASPNGCGDVLNACINDFP